MRYIRYPLLVLLNTILIVIYLLFEFIFMIFGCATLVNNKQFYNDDGHLFGYIIYNVITAPFLFYTILKGIYLLWCKDGLKYNLLTVVTSIFRFISFIWGCIILSNMIKQNTINNYKDNLNELFYGYINYFTLSGCILLFGVINFITKWVKDCKKNNQDLQYKLLTKEEQEDHSVEIVL